MVQKIKNFLYFPLAGYFRFFAQIRLTRWKPRIFVVTGSSGKTTLLNLIQSQLGDQAKYSVKANSSFGIPFDLLDLHRKTLMLSEWPKFFLLAPFRAFKKPPEENLYVVEVDCDRPREGKFLGEFLKPEVTIWVSSTRTHSMNFDGLVQKGNFKSVEDAISFEFASFVKWTKKLVIANVDYEQIKKEVRKIKIPLIRISSLKNLKKYKVSAYGSEFTIDGEVYRFPYFLPKETGASLQMVLALMNYLGLSAKKSFPGFNPPPGRNSVFRGVKGTTLVDSTYNANLDSMRAVINAFGDLENKNKWIVLGDMLEQGKSEKEEHERLAEVVKKYQFERIILMGPRISEHTYPLLKPLTEKGVAVEKYLIPGEVLSYIQKELKGGETILFKGARFLDGVIENLLFDKSEASKLPRREKVWDKWRRRWGV